jgi:hypothetical protein
MRRYVSLIVCAIIAIVLLLYRVSYSDINGGGRPLKVTEWDAFGYYAYLPAIFIYHDVKQLDWLREVDKKYAVTGGNGWQAQRLDNGNYTFKYLGGVAIMQMPWFFIGHFIALHSHYPPDGFSPPYQYALGFGVIVYCIVAIFLLRKILLEYFADSTTGITLLLLCLATNFVEYAAIDNGQSHAYIFPLYVLVLYTTIKWHRQPKALWALLTGYIIGLATISRPTEAIMLFIPLLWNTHSKEAAAHKWRMVKQYRNHLTVAAAAGLAGILPQLIYWKITTGSFIYDVGSKWEFLNPHFRVLFGWEKGWFIYTPVTVFFIVGMFFIKQFPFRKSVLWFCFLNIYIIIAWHDWRYGGSYSTRALVQSYPVFALPLAALVEKVSEKKWRYAFYLLGIYLLFVNLFQVTQYSSTILHYDDMNRRYYGRIYLNAHPTPLDMSLLDNDETLFNESGYNKTAIVRTDTPISTRFTANSFGTIVQAPVNVTGDAKEKRIKIEADIYAPGCLWQTYLNAELQAGGIAKQSRVRLFSPISKDSAVNSYVFYMTMPEHFQNGSLHIYLNSGFNFEGTIRRLTVTQLTR